MLHVLIAWFVHCTIHARSPNLKLPERLKAVSFQPEEEAARSGYSTTVAGSGGQSRWILS
jgi:hypothetical protein